MLVAEAALQANSSWAAYSAAIATLLAAAGAGVVAMWSIRNRRRADIRAEWWRRVEYAIEQCFSDERRRQEIGLEMLTVLGTGHPAGSRLERPHHWSVRWLLPPKGKSVWVVAKDDKKFLIGIIDSIVKGVVDTPGHSASTEAVNKWIRWRTKRGEQ